MKIVKMSEAAKVVVPDAVFTAPVTRQPLVSESKEFFVRIINFGKGVRNKFHAHDSDEVLIISAGKGIMATEKEKRVVSVGDVVFFPAGEKHWHGATEDSELSHIVITKVGMKRTYVED